MRNRNLQVTVLRIGEQLLIEEYVHITINVGRVGGKMENVVALLFTIISFLKY